MALAPVILALAFSLAILSAGGTRLGFIGACLCLGVLAALGVLPCGCFPPVSTVAVLVDQAVGLEVLGAVPEVLGVVSSIEAANLALGIPCDWSPSLVFVSSWPSTTQTLIY